MDIKSTDLVSLFEKSLANIADHNLDKIGFVIQSGNFRCKVHDLKHDEYGELVIFEGGNRGLF